MAMRVRVMTLCPSLAEHPADLSLLALRQHQLERRRFPLGAGDPGPLGPNLAVGEPDSLDKLLHEFGAGSSGHQGAVRIFSTPYRG